MGDSKHRVTVGSAAIDYSNPQAPVIRNIVGFGGRSISIYRPTNTGIELVWDSQSQIEAEACKHFPWAHNGCQDEEYSPVNGAFYNSSDADVREAIEEMNDPNEDGCADGGDGMPGACPLGQTIDSRSPKDGAAPETVVAGVACGRLMAVTATEKQSTVFAYDLSSITSPKLKFVNHLSPASEKKNPAVAY